MPVVPSRSVGTAPLPGVRVNPNVPTAAFPGAVNTRVDLSGVQRVASDLHQQAVERADQVANLDNDNQLSAAAAQIEQSALSLKGKNAMGALQQARADWEKQTAGIGGNASSDAQRRFVQGRAAMQWQRLNETIERHAANEGQQYDNEVTNAALSNRLNDALTNYRDPRVIDSAVNESRAVIEDQARRLGLAPEVVQQAQAEQTSKIHTSVIDRYLTAGDDLSAQSYYAQHQTQILGSDQGRIDKALEVGSTLGASQRNADDILSGRFAPGAVEPGNIDLTNRPKVKNADGSVSTVRSISIEQDGTTVLIPTVVGGKVVSDADAIAHFEKTGEHLGKFSSEQAADSYAQMLHESQARTLTGKQPVDLTAALNQAATITNPKVREGAERQIRQHFEDVAFADRQDRDAAFDQAKEIVRGNGGDATKIPPAVLNKLNTTQEEEIRRIGRNIRYPDHITDDAKYTHLLNFASISPAAFLDIDIRKEYGDDLSRNDLAHLEATQRKIRESQSKAVTTGDNKLKRAEEKTVIDATKAAAKVSDNIKNLPADVSKFLPTPKAVTVPQWMLDSAKTNKPYADYLRLHGVNLDHAATTQAQPTTPRVPGGPLGPPKPIDLSKATP